MLLWGGGGLNIKYSYRWEKKGIALGDQLGQFCGNLQLFLDINIAVYIPQEIYSVRDFLAILRLLSFLRKVCLNGTNPLARGVKRGCFDFSTISRSSMFY